MRKRIPYVGVTCTELHASELHAHLVMTLKACFCDPEDSLYKPDLIGDATTMTKLPAKGTTRKHSANAPNSKPKAEKTGKTQPGAQSDLMQKLKTMMKGDTVPEDSGESGEESPAE